jgi:predicted nucleic acid-binding protein
MRVFVDTSGLYSVIDRSDTNHAAARSIWQRLLNVDDTLVTSNYILVEINALIQHRLGMAAVADLHASIVPALNLVWIDEILHQSAVSVQLATNHRKLSLVDCTSFEICRRMGIVHVFAFDRHFTEQNLILLTA